MILPKIVYLNTAKESLFKTKIEKAWIFALFCRLVAVYLIGKLPCWQNDCNIMRIMFWTILCGGNVYGKNRRSHQIRGGQQHLHLEASL